MAWMLGFIAGVLSLFLPSSSWMLIKLLAIFATLGCGVSCTLFYKYKWRAKYKALIKVVLWSMGGLTVGVLYSQWSALSAERRTLVDERDGEVVLVEAIVTKSSCYVANDGVALNRDGYRRKASCKLGIRSLAAKDLSGSRPSIGSQFNAQLSYYGDAVLRPNDRITAIIKMRSPRGYSNPGSFDLRRFYLARGLSASGYIKSIESYVPFEENKEFSAFGLRSDWLVKITQSTSAFDTQGILLSLLAGEKDKLKASDRDLFQKTGTAHLLAISGLHIGIAAAVGILFSGLLARCFPNLLLYYPMQVWNAVVAIPFAAFYAFLAGFGIPTQRALIMFVCLMLTRCFRLNWPFENHFLIALTVVLLLSPMAILDAGLWFSFGAVLILILSLRKAIKKRETYESWLTKIFLYFSALIKTQFALMLAMPLMLLPFNVPLPLISPLANFVAVPLVSLMIVPLGLLGALLTPLQPDTAEMVFALCNLLLGMLIQLLAFISEINTQHFASWILAGDLSRWMVLLASCYLLFRSHYISVRLLAFTIAMFMFFPPDKVERNSIGESEIRITQLDVGQGTAILVSASGHHWMYDTGARWSESFDMGKAVIIPYLRRAGIHTLDALVLSHGDNDHIGGADSLLNTIAVERIILAGEHVHWPNRYAQSPAVKARLPKTSEQSELAFAETCHQDTRWQLDSFLVQSLWPPLDDKRRSENDSSCVLLISDSDGTALAIFAGDISTASEQQIAATFPIPASGPLLMVGHHGSNTSTGENWLQWASPSRALISAGFNNRYRHPHRKVLERLSSHGIQTLESSELGAIQFIYSDGHWSGPFCSRYYGKFFWQNWDNRDICSGPLKSL